MMRLNVFYIGVIYFSYNRVIFVKEITLYIIRSVRFSEDWFIFDFDDLFQMLFKFYYKA